MEHTAVVLIALQTLILLSLWGILYQVVQQQGRILLRLDRLDRRLGAEDDADVDVPPGLGVGTPLAPFRLPDPDGTMLGLENYSGRRVLLLYWNPACGFCELLAPDLAGKQAALRAAGVELLLVSLDDAASNRALAAESGLSAPILLASRDHPLMTTAFRHMGTPSGYLLDERGRVARSLVIGADAILALVEEVLGASPVRRRLPGERPLTESRIERNGLKAGTPAPMFRLPGLHGETIALEDYRGRRVLLVFTDPHCGPCEALAPHLVRLHEAQEDDGLALIVVARGDVAENQRKAAQHGFTFPVVLQQRWRLSQDFGIFAVPVAFLLDENGTIVADVARGVDEILALARKSTATMTT
jgi:peroxiredoxin